jgi:hypothetical protein
VRRKGALHGKTHQFLVVMPEANMVLKVQRDGSYKVVECQLANTRVSSLTRLPARFHQHGLHLQVVVLIDVGT